VHIHRYTASSTTSSTSFYGPHVQLRCFCIGLANCYFAERGAKRKKEKLNYPVRDKNRKIIQQARENLPKDRLLRIESYPGSQPQISQSVGCHEKIRFFPEGLMLVRVVTHMEMCSFLHGNTFFQCLRYVVDHPPLIRSEEARNDHCKSRTYVDLAYSCVTTSSKVRGTECEAMEKTPGIGCLC
jgi:hypothetical protein